MKITAKKITNEEKTLLLQDLSARLPYGVKYQTYLGDIFILKDITLSRTSAQHYIDDNAFSLIQIKPYLRPMSSMTDKEVNELKMICDDEELRNECGDVVGTIYGMTLLYGKVEDVYPYNLKIKISPNINYAVSDYLNSHHFDYRGLIEKGLALEAPEGMYNFN